MSGFLYLLPALACGAMMAACMWMMNRLHRGQRPEGADQTVDPDEVARLREEVARLSAQRYDGRLTATRR